MSDFIIRAAVPADAAAIIAFWNPMIESGKYTAFTTPFTEEQERAYIVNQTERDIFHVAVRTDDGVIAGFQSMSPYPGVASMAHVGVIGTFVAPAFQRQGIARQLFAKTFDVARPKGYEKIFTFVRADNPVALATYMSQGFRVIGTAQNQIKINGTHVDEVIIERLL